MMVRRGGRVLVRAVLAQLESRHALADCVCRDPGAGDTDQQCLDQEQIADRQRGQPARDTRPAMTAAASESHAAELIALAGSAEVAWMALVCDIELAL
jgi:hypothetical protein